MKIMIDTVLNRYGASNLLLDKPVYILEQRKECFQVRVAAMHKGFIIYQTILATVVCLDNEGYPL